MDHTAEESGVIGFGSCNSSIGSNVCKDNGKSVDSKGEIGSLSCNRGGLNTCASNGVGGEGYIGDCSCNSVDPDATSTSCFRNGMNGLGVIADGACNGNAACNNNSGSIAFGCCNYDGACSDNMETIDKDHPDCRYNGVMAAILGCVA